MKRIHQLFVQWLPLFSFIIDECIWINNEKLILVILTRMLMGRRTEIYVLMSHVMWHLIALSNFQQESSFDYWDLVCIVMVLLEIQCDLFCREREAPWFSSIYNPACILQSYLLGLSSFALSLMMLLYLTNHLPWLSAAFLFSTLWNNILLFKKMFILHLVVFMCVLHVLIDR